MLSILQSGKRVINVDETWLPCSDFRNKKWQIKGLKNSVPEKVISYRVNMIAALDNEGKVYVSIT